MKNRIHTLLLACLCAFFVPYSHAINYLFEVEVSGAQEVHVADPDGVGSGWILINGVTSLLSWGFEIENVDEILAAHIHQGVAGTNGGVVVNFSGALAGSLNVDPTLASDIVANAEQYYVNFHNQPYPGGAVRGQLSEPKAVPETLGAAWAALAIGLTLMAGRRSWRRVRAAS